MEATDFKYNWRKIATAGQEKREFDFLRGRRQRYLILAPKPASNFYERGINTTVAKLKSQSYYYWLSFLDC